MSRENRNPCNAVIRTEDIVESVRLLRIVNSDGVGSQVIAKYIIRRWFLGTGG